MAAAPVPHPAIPVLAERGGTQLRTPRCTVVVDTREQNPETRELLHRGAGRQLCGGAERSTRPCSLLYS